MVEELWVFLKPALGEEGHLPCNSAGLRKGTFPVTQLAELSSMGGFRPLPLPCVLPLPSTAVQSCSHHSPFLPSSGGRCSSSPFCTGRISPQWEGSALPPCTPGILCRCTETQHGVSIPSQQRAHKTLVWEGAH